MNLQHSTQPNYVSELSPILWNYFWSSNCWCKTCRRKRENSIY